MPTTIEKSDFDGISDSSEEFFDCLEEFPAYIYLEDGLRSIQQQSKAFNYLYVSNIEELRGSLQIPPSSFPLVVGSPAVVIWVDVFTNTLTYFDPKGKLAAKHGIDLDHLKKFFFLVTEKSSKSDIKTEMTQIYMRSKLVSILSAKNYKKGKSNF